VAKKRAPTGRRRRRRSVPTSSSYRPVMRTMHNRFEGLGSDAKFGSKLFDVYFRISVGMALGCGLAMWLGYDNNLRSFLGSSLRNHTMVNGIATGLLVSVPVNSFYLLWRSIRQSYARNHNQPVPKYPRYVGRPAGAVTFVTTLISIWA